jgi:hypothetical protein
MYLFAPYEIYARKLDQNNDDVMLADNNTVAPWVALIAKESNNTNGTFSRSI